MPHHETKDEVLHGRNIYRNIYQGTTGPFSTARLLLSRWKGSATRLIWHDLVIFLVLYGLLSILYRHVLFYHPVARQLFEVICIYAGDFSGLIPITFLIGFYVSSVVSRWWDQFMTLPRPDKFAIKLVNYVPGSVSFSSFEICLLHSIIFCTMK